MALLELPSGNANNGQKPRSAFSNWMCPLGVLVGVAIVSGIVWTGSQVTPSGQNPRSPRPPRPSSSLVTPSDPVVPVCTELGYKIIAGVHTDKAHNMKPKYDTSGGISPAIHTKNPDQCWNRCKMAGGCVSAVFNMANVDPSIENGNCFLKDAVPIAYDFVGERSFVFSSLVPCDYEEPDPNVCYRNFDKARADHGKYTTIYNFDDDRKLPWSGGFKVGTEAECWLECEKHPECRSTRFKKTRKAENCWLKRMDYETDETEDKDDWEYSSQAACDFQIRAECRKNGYQFTRRAEPMGVNVIPEGVEVSEAGEFTSETERTCWERCKATDACNSAAFREDTNACRLTEGIAAETAQKSDIYSILYPCKEDRPHPDARPVGECKVRQPHDLGGIEAKGPGWNITTEAFGAKVEATLNFEEKESMCGDAVTVHGDVYIKDFLTGDCEVCMEAKCYFWTPTEEGTYMDECSMTSNITDGTYQFSSVFPGNEALAHWGPDPHPHWHYTCTGCGGSIYGKFYASNWADLDFTDVKESHVPTKDDAFDNDGRFDIVIMKNRYTGF